MIRKIIYINATKNRFQVISFSTAYKFLISFSDSSNVNFFSITWVIFHFKENSCMFQNENMKKLKKNLIQLTQFDSIAWTLFRYRAFYFYFSLLLTLKNWSKIKNSFKMLLACLYISFWIWNKKARRRRYLGRMLKIL